MSENGKRTASLLRKMQMQLPRSSENRKDGRQGRTPSAAARGQARATDPSPGMRRQAPGGIGSSPVT